MDFFPKLKCRRATLIRHTRAWEYEQHYQFLIEHDFSIWVFKGLSSIRRNAVENFYHTVTRASRSFYDNYSQQQVAVFACFWCLQFSFLICPLFPWHCFSPKCSHSPLQSFKLSTSTHLAAGYFARILSRQDFFLAGIHDKLINKRNTNFSISKS